MSDEHTSAKLPSFLLSLGVAVLILGLLARRLFLWERNGTIILSSVPAAIIVALVLAASGILLSRGRIRTLALSCQSFALVLTLVLVSDWLTKSYSLFQGPAVRGEIILLALLAMALSRPMLLGALRFLPIFTVFLTVTSFFLLSKGRLLFSDDHAVFLYRLQLLKDNFPAIPFYNPLWNAGIDSRDFFATGSLSVFFLNLPLVYLFELNSAYNLVVAISVLILTPLSTYLACRLASAERPIPAVAASLALCSSLTWYRWVFKYGTMGFAVSCALLPLVLVLVAKILSARDELKKREAVVFVAAASLMLLWSPTAIVFIPAVIWGLFSIRRLFAKKYIPAVVAALIVINIPWLILFSSVSQVFDYFGGSYPSIYANGNGASADNTIEHRLNSLSVQEREIGPLVSPGDSPSGLDLKISLAVLRHHAVSANPLILILALPGLFCMRRSKVALMFITSAWLCLLGTVMVPVKPHMEFDRMLVILFLLLSIPAAHAVSRLLSEANPSKSKFYLLSLALSLGFLFTGPFAAAKVLNNRSDIRYDFALPIVGELAQAINTHGGEGRTMFAGYILHELSQGHLAPLVHMTKRPLTASTFVHNVWHPKDIIPDEFLKNENRDAGIKEFLDLHNVSSVVTHDEEWFGYFLARTAEFEKVWQMRRFALFRRLAFVGNYFVEGAGEFIAQDSSSLTLRMKSETAVVKFNYFPFLISSACSLSAQKERGGLELIRLERCPIGADIVIRGKTGFSRLWG